ncbi:MULTISPECIES: PA2169 family four-helix-bundle protein [Sphingobacterium]|uniref:PA2169 family four-helix-bundle protein n=1 Tax=Sphingobacterium TaxID=28453 RepID=UPI0013D9EF0D|nr:MULTISPECIES: PA2169 family four-helix-bundle protein [unclassified Sphingobacterium]
MKNVHQETAGLLNQLIEINNDRIEGYEKAISLLPTDGNYGLQATFEKYRDQSIQFKNDLIPLVFREGDKPTDETKTSGKLFRTWMEIKSAIAPYTAKAILESCERGEDEFKKVYRDVIEQSQLAPLNMLSIIQSQANLQLQAHDHIRDLRDNMNS